MHKREQKIDRFESLCLDPQALSRITSNQFIGLNTRLFSRDNYKEKLPALKDQSNALPPHSDEFASPMDAQVLEWAQKDYHKKKPQPKKESKKENFSSGGCGCN